MRSLLKEAFKCICGENRWSYAVFWKIGCQNPTLLIWEEYHYQPTQKCLLPDIHEIDSTELLLKEWEGLWGPRESRLSQNGCHAEDKVCLLINRMMINNHVHVVGEGIVGRAAFTGNHQWILQENCMGKDYPPEVLSEVHHQFLAGMQTVTAIPVLPHGVVQLGSTLAIAENLGFVNDIKSLFAQLGGAPAVISSDYITETNMLPKIGISPSIDTPIHAESARNSRSQVERSTPILSANCNQEISSSQAKELVSRFGHSLVTQAQNYMPPNASASQTTPCVSSVMSTSIGNTAQIKSRRVIKPNLPLRGQLELGAVGAQIILPDARLMQPASPYNSSNRFSDQHVQSGASWTNLKFMEKQILPRSGSQVQVSGVIPTLNNLNTSQLRMGGGAICNSSKDSVIESLLSGSEPPNAGNGHHRLTSRGSCSISSGSAENYSGCLPLKRPQFSSSDTGGIPVSNTGDPSINSSVLLGVPERSFTSVSDNLTLTGLTKGKQVMESDLFQALNIPTAYLDNDIPRCVPMPDFSNDCSMSGLKQDKESIRPQNVICEDSCEQIPYGDDLFDILGRDFKGGEHYGIWNSSLIRGADLNISTLSMDASTCINPTGASNAFYPVDDGFSDSGVFNQTVSDHLLDAVVSKVHSSGKQNSNDDKSCWTILTKSSSSAPTSGHVKVTNQKQATFGFPPPCAKSQVTGSSSLRSGCSKDTVGESSLINSMYGSQISLLCEDSQEMKCDNSISTAHSKKPDEAGKANRKRLRPGENPRPRPKDRQMIQDRLKELREIVPNGAKCSIDALLEKTIKHMLFLQSVTNHAEKLKHSGESKIISKDGGVFLKDNFEGGATWAFEVGSQSMACPIIVEDLNPPRQMLVEMLCVEQGFFLEIADIIRGLGLTILKGVMEARNDEVWVRFTVEANRDVTRMEIFLSLVHMLEQTMKSSSSASKDSDDGNSKSHNTFNQASIPATGHSVSLQ